ncbi:cell wall metabolism sensor histidine kinase WalK [Candidatus Beckwithbacteria bacterium]|nr:cell wall metabolism sensor histidine kinase WalK [Candidatus Beckwithbacteria bacterium]
MKVQYKLTIIILLILWISIAILSFSSNYLAQKTLEKNVEDQIVDVTTFKEIQINKFINSVQKQLQDIANVGMASDYLFQFHNSLEEKLNMAAEENEKIAEASVSAFLKEKILFTNFSEISILTEKGKIDITTNDKLVDQYTTNEKFYIEGKKDIYVEIKNYNQEFNNKEILIAIPVKLRQSEDRAVIIGKVPLNNLNDIILERTGLDTSGRSYLVDIDKNLLTFVDNNQQPPTEMKDVKVESEIIDLCIKHKSENPLVLKDYLNFEHKSVIGTYHWLPSINACLITEINRDEALNIVKIINQSIRTHSLVITIIVAFLVWLFAKFMTKRVSILKEQVEAVAKGNFDQVIKVSQKDEISDLAKSFDKLRLEIKNLKKSLEDQVQQGSKELNKKLVDLEKMRDLMVDSEIYAEKMRLENEKLMLQLKKRKGK